MTVTRSDAVRVRLDAIAFDAGTQIRAAINEHVVSEYAERMTEGAAFPPIVLFHDGNTHYLADGFHRYMASQRVGFTDIDADVRAGTKQDALWFALGANRTNGVRLTEADKKSAILLALRAWPTKSSKELADQIGVNQGYFSRVKAQHNVQTTPEVDRVIGKDGKNYPASSPKPTRPESEQLAAVKALAAAGCSSNEIRERTGAAVGTIAKARKQLGLAGVDNSRRAVNVRKERIRALAADGYTSRQIAADVEISVDRVREIAKREAVDIYADRAVGNTLRHNPNRIVGRIVIDAENLTEGVDLVDFSKLDRAELPGWLASLKRSRDQLSAFIRRLMQEQQDNGEAA